jgi:hypothetical protein
VQFFTIKILPRLIPLSAHYFKGGIYLVQEQYNIKQDDHITLPRLKEAAYAMANSTSHAAAGGDIWNNVVTKHDWLTGKNGDMSANFFSFALKSFRYLHMSLLLNSIPYLPTVLRGIKIIQI